MIIAPTRINSKMPFWAAAEQERKRASSIFRVSNDDSLCMCNATKGDTALFASRRPINKAQKNYKLHTHFK